MKSTVEESNTGDVIEQIQSEVEDDYSNDDLYNINSYGADLSFRELISMYKEKELEKPELQRHYVWDKAEASRFIESLLLGLPVPSIFLAKTSSEKKLIVDGYQRIMTVFDYVEKGIFSKDGKTFKLSNSKKINPRWRNKAFQELPEADQRRIRSTTIHSIIFEQKEPKDNDSSMYQVFERINTSGKTLLPQEIRNCIYQGAFNSLLFKLNVDRTWRTLFGIPTVDSRMRDMEFILRFFALKRENILETAQTISIKQHLNEFMGGNSNMSPETAAQFEREFLGSIAFLHRSFGENAFRNLSTKGDGIFTDKFHPTIFDALAISTNYALAKNPELKVADLLDRRLALLGDANFKAYTRTRTTDVAHIHGRIGLALQYLFDMKYE